MRYPLRPLAVSCDAMHPDGTINVAALARATGVASRSIWRIEKAGGLSWSRADEVAVAIDRTPEEIWPGWLERTLCDA